MAFDHLGRAGRRFMMKHSAAAAKLRPATLTEIPRSTWSPELLLPGNATRAWMSNKFLAQLFDVAPFNGIDTRRLSVNRVTLKLDGKWDEDLTWDELMQVKREVGFSDWYALEVYPRDKDIIDVANIRHLWLLAVPLNLGWLTERTRK